MYSAGGFVADVDAVADLDGSEGVHSNINDNNQEKEYAILE